MKNIKKQGELASSQLPTRIGKHPLSAALALALLASGCGGGSGGGDLDIAEAAAQY